jgi:6-phosphogluconolactonase (cycloisomerase 2 family)
MAGRGPASLLAYNSFLYALNGLDHTISAYSVDQNTGVLTEIPGSPFPAGTAVAGLINGNGGVLYVPDTQSKSILAFSVDGSTGSLAPLPGSPFPTSVGPVALTRVVTPILTPP